ncbi:hypothetical protein HYT45_00210 [Candidatus Uhrbacteria bacterium]|nr:hypothetical protein [Candidatus Uhrbacteria bacterium]
MPWWQNLIEYLRRDQPYPAPEEGFDVRQAVQSVIVESAVDVLYYFLGIFTYFYFLAIAYVFFIAPEVSQAIFGQVLDSLVEPYLGGVGIYVILKEIRKRRGGFKRSNHFGEIFVFSWLTFMAVAAFLVAWSPKFDFDATMSSIVTISLSSFIIYIGGVIHRP